MTSHSLQAGDSIKICAIYTRKSTEQNGVADEEKSVTRQSAGCQRRRDRAEAKYPTFDAERSTDGGIA